MLIAAEVVTALLVAVAMALALAHALELPGKLRLPRETYMAVQQIYYPGFTIGGVGEIAAVAATLVLALHAIGDGARFWLMLGAFASLLAMHAVYWLLVHPVNNFWLKDFDLKAASAQFFAAGLLRRQPGAEDWTILRDRWEWSHVLRACLGMVSLALLVTALTL